MTIGIVPSTQQKMYVHVEADLDEEPVKTDQINLDVGDAPASKSTEDKSATEADKKGKKDTAPAATISKIYSISSPGDRALVWFGFFLSFVEGAFQPTYSIVLASLMSIFVQGLAEEEREERITFVFKLTVGICAVSFVLAIFSYSITQVGAEKNAFKLRSVYLKELMKKENAWFEKQDLEALPSKISDSFLLIADGSGEKLGKLICASGNILSGFVIAFSAGPVLAAIYVLYLPMFAFVAKNLMGAVRA